MEKEQFEKEQMDLIMRVIENVSHKVQSLLDPPLLTLISDNAGNDEGASCSLAPCGFDVNLVD